jgi:16S rRNA (cytosine967-C5)-methyltransferase
MYRGGMNFREHHLFEILKLHDGRQMPIDALLSQYFRANKAVGSKDRRFISEAIYGMVRWRGLLDHMAEKPTWEERFKVFLRRPPAEYRNEGEIPLHVRASFPKALFQLLVSHFGEERAFELCLICNAPAPTTIRVNRLKTTRDGLLERWKGLYDVSATKQSPDGIVFHKKVNFFGLPEFKEGLFEIQDEGSQLVAGLVEAKPGDEVLDFCAGAGGKSLAFAPAMQGKGQIYLHDIRKSALEEAKKRIRRAGIQNAQIVFPDDPKLNLLKGRMDWVLVDAPCTGLGTLRRNPDMKWKFTPDMVERIVAEQRAIFAQAATYLNPKGKIVYATCSILPDENESQLAYFKEQLGKEERAVFSSSPTPGGMDGFFGVTFF